MLGPHGLVTSGSHCQRHRRKGLSDLKPWAGQKTTLNDWPLYLTVRQEELHGPSRDCTSALLRQSPVKQPGYRVPSQEPAAQTPALSTPCQVTRGKQCVSSHGYKGQGTPTEGGAGKWVLYPDETPRIMHLSPWAAGHPLMLWDLSAHVLHRPRRLVISSLGPCKGVGT